MTSLFSCNSSHTYTPSNIIYRNTGNHNRVYEWMNGWMNEWMSMLVCVSGESWVITNQRSFVCVYSLSHLFVKRKRKCFVKNKNSLMFTLFCVPHFISLLFYGAMVLLLCSFYGWFFSCLLIIVALFIQTLDFFLILLHSLCVCFVCLQTIQFIISLSINSSSNSTIIRFIYFNELSPKKPKQYNQE